ncbi:hypothetical protein V6Z88_003769 [Aspergillus fumigatus]|nr:hypothetical protein KXX44_007314 [Aspergillus fumigatus]KAH1859612.1 hypothetical protein KXX55_003095 [Aspergillus fumigatus]KAH2444890.1 hypothetical protein KXV83_001795 [Aspergillus fumigatus]KAH2977146.1 hypothetical protein KXW58_006063 [Aspergillus fumigatus]KAH3050617.1 hypothetical protein KXW01_005400 [Aspergillus fumigatus]
MAGADQGDVHDDLCISDRDWIHSAILLCAGYEVSVNIYEEDVPGRWSEKLIGIACNFKRNPNGLHTLQTALFAVHNVSELAHVITTDAMPLIPGVTQPWVFAGFASALRKSKGDRERPCSLRCRQEIAKLHQPLNDWSPQ